LADVYNFPASRFPPAARRTPRIARWSHGTRHQRGGVERAARHFRPAHADRAGSRCLGHDPPVRRRPRRHRADRLLQLHQLGPQQQSVWCHRRSGHADHVGSGRHGYGGRAIPGLGTWPV